MPRYLKSIVVLLATATPIAAWSSEPGSPLPRPTGGYRVGTRVLEPFVDEARPDERFDSGARTVLVQMWYPTSVRDGKRSLYFTDPELLESVKAGSSAPDKVESWRTLTTHAVENAPVAEGTFPLVLFSPGFGMARAYYTSWIEELVSHGFVVASIDHPFAGHTRIDGRVIENQQHPDGPEGQTGDMAADLRFLLPLLSQRPEVDSKRVAAVGHSIGGAAALEACRLEGHIAGCVNLDGAAFGAFAKTGVGRPFLVIHQQPVFEGPGPDGRLAELGREIEKEWQDIIAKQAAPVVRLSVHGTGHLSFSDALFIRPELVADGGGQVADPLQVLRQTVTVIREFLRNVFAGTPGLELSTPDLISPARMGQVD